ncbi:MAG: terminase small subunit [Clostridium tyrobutyricum]|jgi:phage terminase small subunit|uniref:terminase small subunit n=1 Tax=Clostridium tyrobutyricum TaxID=1519 RepID=UPI0002EEBE28|nr:terminase small subunit [Clostridium tyrobutyricum]MCH4199263.1 terminase small subunit [Clostridium tyrobutyricum]MCH4236595.1 terminase small subunit [Clostridium tyrobutyricum]MCH4258089.1 terminase small subunit [Clostridium tyrobutyricum]MCI1239128.1 terminase small subunit [Clostridium tyrobutyricum]MCI1651400.1 terminase small subunit [Clostridium tyrobutyricum]
MPRQRSPNRDKAFEIYKENDGNIDLVKIAQMLNLSPGTIRGWKNKDKWDSKLNGTLQKNTERSKRKKNKVNKEPKLEEVTELLNSELTDKQRLFCIYYPKCFNATKAAKKAGYSEDTAYSIGWELLKKPEIKAEIQRLKQNKLNRAMLDPDDIFQRYLDIAFACITDYVSFGQRSYKVKDKKGKERTIMYNYVDLNNSDQVDGSLISEVKQGKDGVSIKLHDAMKALDWLSKHMDIATEEQKLKCEKLRAEIEKTKGDGKHDEAKTWADKIQEIASKRRGKDG